MTPEVVETPVEVTPTEEVSVGQTPEVTTEPEVVA